MFESFSDEGSIPSVSTHICMENKITPAELQAPSHYVITVKEFHDENYTNKVKGGLCIVGLLVGEPKREDYFSDTEYKSNKKAFDLVVRMSPTGNLQTFQECEKAKDIDYYVMRSLDPSGGVGSMGMSGETKLLVFPRKPSLSEGTKTFISA